MELGVKILGFHSFYKWKPHHQRIDIYSGPSVSVGELFPDPLCTLVSMDSPPPKKKPSKVFFYIHVDRSDRAHYYSSGLQPSGTPVQIDLFAAELCLSHNPHCILGFILPVHIECCSCLVGLNTAPGN